MEVTFLLKILQWIYSVRVRLQLLTVVCKASLDLPSSCPPSVISCHSQLYYTGSL